MNDLVKRLRQEAGRNALMQSDKEHHTNRRRNTFRGRNMLFTQAADRIEELEKQVERLDVSLRLANGDLLNAQAQLDEADESLMNIRKGYTKTIEYNLAPAMVESALRDKLIELGWTPPAQEGE